jgi:hypothetical protein
MSRIIGKDGSEQTFRSSSGTQVEPALQGSGSRRQGEFIVFGEPGPDGQEFVYRDTGFEGFPQRRLETENLQGCHKTSR